MAIDKVDGGSADRMRREMESRQNDMLEEQQRELLAVDSAAQSAQEVAAQEVAAEGNIGDGSEIAKAGEAGGVSTETQMEMNQEDPGLAANASDQQDRGENWKAFASNQDDSLSRAAAEKDINNQLADDNGDEKVEEAKKIQVADLLKEMTLQSGRIKS